MCAVVEIYSEWCGVCKSVIPLFKRIRLDKEDEACLLFVTVRNACKRANQFDLCGGMGMREVMGIEPYAIAL